MYKSVCVLLIIAFVKLKPVDSDARVIRLGCNASNFLFKNPICRLRSMSRKFQLMTIGYEIAEKMNVFMVNFRNMYKSSNNIYWRQIMSIDNINVCQLMKGANSIPLMTYYRDMFYRLMPNLPRNCPFPNGRYLTQNITLTKDTGVGVENQISSTPLPNGIYRVTLKFFSDKDKVGITFWYHIEKYYVDNVELALKKK